MRRLRTTTPWRVPGPDTLRGRLALLALIATALWVALLTGGFNLALSARLGDQADDLLRTRAAAVAATLETRPDGGIVVHEPADDGALDAGIWIYQGDRAIERPKAPLRLQRQADRLAGHGKVFTETAGPHASRLYALAVHAPHNSGRQVGTVVASVGLDPYRSMARATLAGSAVLGLLLLGVVYLVTRAIVGRALRPVAEMSAQAARWSEGGAAERFGVAGRPDELASLAANLDELLDRLAAVLRHEQQQSAELSHELRTPLARIVAETDWLTARRRDATAQRASHAAIASAAATMQRICETLLSEARTRSASVPGRCALPDLARDLARRCAEEHPQAVPVVVRGGAVTAGVAASVAERILTPLLDNARRYAVRTITIECAQVPGGVEVAVADDGPGVPADVGPAVFEPGRRADPADGHDGAGLGLALARRLARAAGGDIHLAPCPAGARFVVRLPAG
ncbi:HAMP domain-containing histidine kinase [Microtetraspora sp. AC03309]|uniref:ATP-binding protein n=1 Tax=Microtetraspora sp. AC03309 TaxID=2779376 RepID=UPI001E2D5A48|nr:HAMP domain-containing sensor histidine kinase [Microtetraspora sp. AC03309]MCC5576324.1 HAMP domain-containing histidine kinase [Microtetraspora sp. AC03309]